MANINNTIPAVRQRVFEKVNNVDTFTRPWYLFFQQVYKMLLADTTVQIPVLLNGWVDYDAVHEGASFFKNPFGYVYIRGLIRSGVLNTVLFVLPEGYRPIKPLIFTGTCIGGGGYAIAEINIKPTGEVYAYCSANNWLTLSGICFRIDA